MSLGIDDSPNLSGVTPMQLEDIERFEGCLVETYKYSLQLKRRYQLVLLVIVIWLLWSFTALLRWCISVGEVFPEGSFFLFANVFASGVALRLFFSTGAYASGIEAPKHFVPSCNGALAALNIHLNPSTLRLERGAADNDNPSLRSTVGKFGG